MPITPELLERIFEELAPRREASYKPDVKKALSTCLFVSKIIRDLAASRLFHALELKSSFENCLLEVLVDVLKAPDGLEWMSIRPYIRRFAFVIDSPPQAQHNTDGDDPETAAQPNENLITTFRVCTVTDGNYGSQIDSFNIQAKPAALTLAPQVESVVLDFLRIPSLRTLEIHGALFKGNFLQDTYIQRLSVSNPSFAWDQKTAQEDPVPGEPDGSRTNYPELIALETDLVWPGRSFGLHDPPSFPNLQSLDIEIWNSFAFKEAQILIANVCTSLSSLKITYEFDGYEPELPDDWTVDFGKLRALRSLEFKWKNATFSNHEENVGRGSRPLQTFLSLLNAVESSLLNLTSVRWSFQYRRDMLPSEVLWNWLEKDSKWNALDEKLSSSLFPALESVHFNFASISPIFHEDIPEGVELSNDPAFMTALFDLKLLEALAPEKGRGAFPRLAESLKDNLKVEGEGTLYVARKADVEERLGNSR